MSRGLQNESNSYRLVKLSVMELCMCHALHWVSIFKFNFHSTLWTMLHRLSFSLPSLNKPFCIFKKFLQGLPLLYFGFFLLYGHWRVHVLLINCFLTYRAQRPLSFTCWLHSTLLLQGILRQRVLVSLYFSSCNWFVWSFLF